jgi:opine dehydrogenase
MTDIRKIAVLGGGNGAHATAVDLSLKGLDVNICEAPEFKESFKTTLERQAITLINIWSEEKVAKLNLATTDFEEALDGLTYIMMPIPVTGHIFFSKSIIPYLKDGHVILSWPGNFSAFLFAKMLGEKEIKKNIILAEGHTLPWGCRLEAPGKIRLAVESWKLLLSAFPAKHTIEVLDVLKYFYPVVPSENVLATSLNNLNPIVHPVGCVLNAGWIDTLGKDFNFYKHGTAISVARAIKNIYEEVSKVAEVVGVKMLEYPE